LNKDFTQALMPFCHRTNSDKALNDVQQQTKILITTVKQLAQNNKPEFGAKDDES